MSRTTHFPALRVLLSGALAGLGTLIASAAHAQSVTGAEAMLNAIPRLGFEIRSAEPVARGNIDGATALLGSRATDDRVSAIQSVGPAAQDLPIDGERALMGRGSDAWSPGNRPRVSRVDE